MNSERMERYIAFLEQDYDRLKAAGGDLPVQVDTLRNALALAVGIIEELFSTLPDGPQGSHKADLAMMIHVLDQTTPT